jgi:hypothetical protein
MNKLFLLFLLFFLFSLFIPMEKLSAQNLSTTSATTVTYGAVKKLSTAGSQSETFDTTDFPQWAKDLRRWNIITFGLYPFSIFAVTFTTEMIHWYEANGLDWSESGRQYAPWPFKSAGSIEMTNDEYVRTILLALGLSAAVAVIDLIIVNIKRSNERRRIESMPSGSVEIEFFPYGIPEKTDEEDEEEIE